jgi:hypothetical protein
MVYGCNVLIQLNNVTQKSGNASAALMAENKLTEGER